MRDEIKETWACSPFDSDVEDLADISGTSDLEEKLTEIRKDETPRLNFQKQPLSMF